MLGIVRMCEKLTTFPEPGGLFDQDAYLMYLFREVFDADAERENNEAKRQKAEQEKLQAQQKASSRRRR